MGWVPCYMDGTLLCMQAKNKQAEIEQRAYLDPQKSLEEKEKGNACFKQG